jgi:16S rRNA (adenine1518-N6/adenine1519-N6)-dimethyltransferase
VIKPKKSLGQHFLIDRNIAKKIVKSLQADQSKHIIEVGSGTGMLSQYLFERFKDCVYLVELDDESISFLKNYFPGKCNQILHQDFIEFDLPSTFDAPISVIGSFPYNISSQIFFKVLENRNLIDETVGMIQKEVVERIVAPPGSRTYGILSVLIQAFYHAEYLFTVSKNVFIPPPNVLSAVIRLKRNNRAQLDCNEALFFKIVKAAFNQRRKTIRNSLKSFLLNLQSDHELFSKRPEQLSVPEFEELTNIIENQ